MLRPCLYYTDLGSLLLRQKTKSVATGGASMPRHRVCVHQCPALPRAAQLFRFNAAEAAEGCIMSSSNFGTIQRKYGAVWRCYSLTYEAVHSLVTVATCRMICSTSAWSNPDLRTIYKPITTVHLGVHLCSVKDGIETKHNRRRPSLNVKVQNLGLPCGTIF